MSYSKTSLGAGQVAAVRLSRRGKLILCAVIGVLLAVGLAVGIWSAVTSDQYGTSANGCVSMTIASSTGGQPIHYCGAAAKSFCRSAYAKSDRLSLLARPQCELAGLTKSKVDAG